MTTPTREPRPDLRLLLPAGLAWLCSASITSTSRGLSLSVVLGGAALGGLLLRPRRAIPTALVMSFLVAALAAVSATLHAHGLVSGPLARAAAARSVATVEAVVSGDPVARAGSVVGAARAADQVVLRVQARRVTVAGSTWQLAQPLLVVAPTGRWSTLLPSQRVVIDGRLDRARPGEDLTAVLRASGQPLSVGPATLVQRTAAAVRSGLRKASSGLAPAERGLLPGLVIGDTTGLDTSVRDDFQRTGLTHLVAVSGANVAVVLALAMGLARRARAGPALSALVGGLALAGFVVVARPSPSVLRAAVMGALVLYAGLRSRERRGLPVLCAAVVVLLVVDPALARAPGFVLSVLATGGLVLLAPAWTERLAHRLPRPVAAAIAVPLAAQVACAPYIAATWGTVSLVAVPANLLAAPAVPLATVAGVASAVTAPWLLPVARVAAQVAALPCGWLVRVAEWGAGLPGSVVAWPHGLTGAGAVVACCGVLARAVRHPPARRLLAAGATSAYLASATVVPAVSPQWPPSGWQMVACDVGQGDALVLRGDRAAGDVLVDSGPDPAKLRGCLHLLGVHRLALVILTHLHADHVEGLPAILGRMPVTEVEIGPLLEPPEEWQRVQAWTRAAGVPISRAVLGEQRSLSGLAWTVLGPAAAFHGTDSDPNNSSLVMRVRMPGLTLLLTGDAEDIAQAALMGRGPDLRADVLKVPHHGSAKQLPAFLAASGATVSITSVGLGNPYGHPAPSTIATLAAEGAEPLRTDLDGGVAVLRRGDAVVAEAQHRHRRSDPVPVGLTTRLPVGVWRDPRWWCD